ncbi:unnamed protein product [Cladocopium goreaui]|uniref:4-hydroxy-3-methylbut-2-en-1-yl diphosphate synthase (Flavodoxin) (1-hydroxy-2-methyl-2-(E)-buteny l 4-diphosphate synthase) n=1 Tax=Cladocopium goreaui TaxID=2562237 RepID=A0A9P1D8G5_9DINO|nr:unnamed protein product [Cladocopium goreaui]
MALAPAFVAANSGPLSHLVQQERPRTVSTPEVSTSRSQGSKAAVAAGSLALVLGSRTKGVRRAKKVHVVPTRTTRPAAPSGVYCEAAEKCERRKTRTVYVGEVPVGSEHPIATQTMRDTQPPSATGVRFEIFGQGAFLTTTLTSDVDGTVEQIKKCADMGIDIVRITVQGMKEAKACEGIKKKLLEDGYKTPIVADIHFTPKVALVCADFVDKVRVNPGNFTEGPEPEIIRDRCEIGRKSFDTIDELSEEDIKEAQDAIEEALTPLVLKLKEQNKAMRIGVNHGSLSERILFQYGDSPEGMVASAIEFGEVCRKHDFHNFIFSMKSSNPQVMVNAYRQLAREMYKLGWDYPLHLGVTEAGGGADGFGLRKTGRTLTWRSSLGSRIKSAVGIGALLLDGLGQILSHGRISSSHWLIDCSMEHDSGYLGPQHESSANAESGQLSQVPGSLQGKMSQLEWEEEFRRRLIEAEYQYEVLDTEERFREELRLMDLKSLERERREKAFEAGQLSIDEEEAQDEEDEVDSPLYDLISWIGNMMFPASLRVADGVDSGPNGRISSSHWLIDCSMEHDSGYLGPQHESSANADSGQLSQLPGKMSQLEWEEEFRRRLIEAEYQYEVLDTEERFREELRLMDLKSLERERREKAFEAGLLSIDEEEAQDEEHEVDSPLYDLISWIGNMMFPESDTIRVSLTEDPEYEAKPCVALRGVAEQALGKGVEPFEEKTDRRKGVFYRRECTWPIDVPLNQDGSVFARMSVKELASLDTAQMCDRLGLRLRADGDVQKDWKSVDVVVLDGMVTPNVGVKLKTLMDVPTGVICKAGPNVPDGATILVTCEDAAEGEKMSERLGGYAMVFNGEESEETMLAALNNASPRLVMLKPKSDGRTFLARRFFAKLRQCESSVPAMLWYEYPKEEGKDQDDVVVNASADFGSLFVDGMGEGLLWDAEELAPDMLRESSFNLLQASRMRISKTEFISCPSCGRTLFNLQDTTAKIQERTGHLPGVRIAVMGCIVNGPGEMADADFGYVGSGVGKIDLYVKYDCVKRGIPSENAVEALVDLIKENGRWTEPADAEDVEAEVGAVAVL